MSEETLIRNSSPTLAGIKTASLFSCDYEDRKTLMEEIRAYNAMLVKKGIVIIPLKIEAGRALVYVYRPKLLEVTLENELSRRILTHFGYKDIKSESAAKQIFHLIKRLEGSEFPHETGIFLGYPPEDVIGFIENKAKNFKFSGLWKVYGDVDEAIKMMDSYKKCTRTYMRLINSGYHIDNLAVSR